MGTGASRHLRSCLQPLSSGGVCVGSGEVSTVFEPGPLDETLGHSFCYLRSSSQAHSWSPPVSSAAEVAFKSISGASVSANSSSTVNLFDNSAVRVDSGFQSSSSFSAFPLQVTSSGDRGFSLSGPIESSDASGPFSGPLVKRKRRSTRSFLSGRFSDASIFRRSLSEKTGPCVVPLRAIHAGRCDPGFDDPPPEGAGAVHWAQCKAGEDRVHVVISEEHRWVFVGIYDGFNGAEAPEFLVANLYRSVFNELKGLFWEEVEGSTVESREKRVEFKSEECCDSNKPTKRLWEFLAEREGEGGLEFAGSGRFVFSLSKRRAQFGSWWKGGGRTWSSRCAIDSVEKVKESLEIPEISNFRRRKAGAVDDHDLVLRALSRALEATELSYLEMTDRAMNCNPELALNGSCLLVVLIRDDDVYVMNVGDSRAIVAQSRLQGSAESRRVNGVDFGGAGSNLEIVEGKELGALQLSTDHNTSIPEEILRIKEEHPDDSRCIVNGRVKGRLKVTRAFGAGYLKQLKWNTGLLEIFRNDFIGTTPYISCVPSLCHHKLGPIDQFLVLSSDGLYQYLSNEEVVLHVESFMDRFPDGDPAQSLIEELLFRAAKKAGMEFNELLEIPQGDRRKYHDDVTIMVISLEGRIWKSSGKYI